MKADFLEEQLNLIYIQEDLKSFTPEKIKNIFSKVKKINPDNATDIKNQLPHVASYNTIVAFAKKNPGLYDNYLKEKRKKSNLSEETKNIRDMSVAAVKTLHQHAVINKNPKAQLIKEILDEIQEFFVSVGAYFLFVGGLVKLTIFLANRFKIIYELLPELTSSKNDDVIATYLIIIGVCLMLISYAITILRKASKRRKKKDKSTSAKKSYKGEI
jgi:hypothetical protein